MQYNLPDDPKTLRTTIDKSVISLKHVVAGIWKRHDTTDTTDLCPHQLVTELGIVTDLLQGSYGKTDVMYNIIFSLICCAVLYFMCFGVEFIMLYIPTRTLWFYVFAYISKFRFIFSCCLPFTFVLFLLYFA